jgi:hypothetical protein
MENEGYHASSVNPPGVQANAVAHPSWRDRAENASRDEVAWVATTAI